MLIEKEAKDNLLKGKWSMNVRGRLFSRDRPLVMGILNLSPDSFFDGGKYRERETVVQRTRQMISEGADIIDIGAVSTRPGAVIVDAAEEKSRLLPFLKVIRTEFPDIIISVDTYHSEVARASVEGGADMINDISAGSFDKNMFKTIAELQVPYVLMHMKGTPANMQKSPDYEDVVKEVFHFLSKKAAELLDLGVNDLIIDPGFGFGKTLEQNFLLLRKLEYFIELGFPVLAGVSRKRMINQLLDIKAAEALNGTTVVNVLALQNGASVLRVHDVAEAVQAVKILTFTQKFS